MRPAPRALAWLIAGAVLAVIVVALIAWRVLRSADAKPEAAPPSAFVTIARAQSGDVVEMLEAYGAIAGAAGASRTVAAPRALVVEALLVGPGQQVAAGAPLAVVANTAATDLTRRQGADAAAFAAQDLARVRRLYDQRLAANDQLIAARKALADAQANLASLAATGADQGRQTLKAPFAGVVSGLSASVGEHVAADQPLLGLVPVGGLVAALGVDPAKASVIRPGQPARIRSAMDPTRTFTGKVSLVGAQVDPQTRLLTVTVPVTAPGFALGAAIKGEIAVASHPGLTVPRAAVVYDEAGAHVFAINTGKARQVAVITGLEQGDDIVVTGSLAPGTAVAVEGAYQLQDGMAVRIAPQ